MVHDRATAIRNGSKFYAAFVTRFYGCALVQIYPRKGHGIDFSETAAEYETALDGATASARREIKKLETQLADGLLKWADVFDDRKD